MLTTLFDNSSIKKMSLGRYIWVRLFGYTRESTYPSILSYTTDYGKPATIRICNKIILFLEKLSLHRTFEDLLLDLPVTQPCHANDIWAVFSSFNNLTLFYHASQTTIVRCHQGRFFGERPVHASLHGFHFGSFTATHCCRMFCPVFTVGISRIFYCSSHAAVFEIVFAYDRSSPNR